MRILEGLALAAGVAAMVVTAAYGQGVANLLIAGVVCLGIAGCAAVRRVGLRRSGGSVPALAAGLASAMGVVWAWGGIAILAVYVLAIHSWHEWWQFFLGFAVAAVVSSLVGVALQRDAEAGVVDETMLTVANRLAWGQLIGMIAAVTGLIIDRKATHFLQPERYPDWAANNVFLMGAAALAGLSLWAVSVGRKTGNEVASPDGAGNGHR